VRRPLRASPSLKRVHRLMLPRISGDDSQLAHGSVMNRIRSRLRLVTYDPREPDYAKQSSKHSHEHHHWEQRGHHARVTTGAAMITCTPICEGKPYATHQDFSALM
jgi:hypothetical protein